MFCARYRLGQVANEAPADIKSNLTRAWANFDQEKIDSCNKPTEYKACLFSLCWFHSIVLGEKEHRIQPKTVIARRGRLSETYSSTMVDDKTSQLIAVADPR